MRRAVASILIAPLSLLLSSCRESYEDSDIRGFLEITERGRATSSVTRVEGGAYAVVVYDPEAKDFFHIRAGKKIFKLTEKGSSTQLKIMDSRRAPLATIRIPNSAIQKSNEFRAAPMEIGQSFGLSSSRQLVLIRKEYVKKGGRNCDLCGTEKKKSKRTRLETEIKVPAYRVSGCNGVIGKVWRIIDERYDYEFQFTDDFGAGPDSVIATFRSTGERREPRIDVVKLDACTPSLEIYRDENGMF
jgi:hypothetical protein